MHGNNCRRSCLSLDDADLQHRLDIPIREVCPCLLPEHFKILGTSCDLRCGLGIGGADGNAPRDYLTGPGYRDVDLGILRDFRFEGMTFQIRGEATNAFNMVSLNGPASSGVANTVGGTPTSSTIGKITSAGTPRLIQVGARLTF